MQKINQIISSSSVSDEHLNRTFNSQRSKYATSRNIYWLEHPLPWRAIFICCSFLVSTLFLTKHYADKTIEAQRDLKTWTTKIVNHQELYLRQSIESNERPDDFEYALSLLNSLEPQYPSVLKSIPDLRVFGYHFARAQKLAYVGTPVIEITYLARSGGPVSYYIMPEDSPKHGHIHQKHQRLASVSWRSGKFRHLFIGEMDPEKLSLIAAALDS